jgi:hypothetical protein
MATESDYYTPPGSEIEPGDVFLEMPFPALKYPLTFFRVNRNKDPKAAQLFTPEESEPSGGDCPRSSMDLRAVMLLSHGCEVERVVKREDPTKRHWLCAPILPLEDCSDEMKVRIREGRQPNRFYMPAASFTGGAEMQVDLRKITPINCQYFVDAENDQRRVASLTATARLELHAQLGVFFSGLALYVQEIPCPGCGLPIDPTLFQIRSDDEPDID